MTRFISKALFFLTLTFSSTLFGQGRVDSDPILHNLWWTTYKIDNDANLSCTNKLISNKNDQVKFVAHYTKGDTVYKIVELETILEGTKMTSVYYAVNKPIFISVVKNNYHLTADKEQFFKVVASFNDIVDTNNIQHKQFYKNFYQAKYYFYKDTVRYVNTMKENKILVDNKIDRDKGLDLYYQWKRLLMTKQ